MALTSINLREANKSAEGAIPQEAIPESGVDLGFEGKARVHMEKLLNLFRRHMTGTRSNKESSADRAVANIRTFTRFTARPLWEWTKDDLPAFLQHKCAAIVGGLSHASQGGYITYLRILQNYLMHDIGLRNEIFQKFGVQLQEWVDQSNSVVLKGRRSKRKKLTFALSDDEFNMLIAEFDAQIAVAFETNSKARYPLVRDKTMTIVAYTYALRVSELVSLHSWNFLEDKRYPQFKGYAMLDLIGKGDYEGSVHALDPMIVNVLDFYVQYIRPEFQDQNTVDTELFFYSERGGAVCDEQFRRRLNQIGKSAGIKKRVAPHMLRRTNATDSMNLLGPVGTQKNIRHKDIGTTYDSYYRPDPNELGRDIANAIGQVAAARSRKPSEDSQ